MPSFLTEILQSMRTKLDTKTGATFFLTDFVGRGFFVHFFQVGNIERLNFWSVEMGFGRCFGNEMGRDESSIPIEQSEERKTIDSVKERGPKSKFHR